MIIFKYTSDEYGCFSNFSPHPIVVDGNHTVQINNSYDNSDDFLKKYLAKGIAVD